MIASRAAAHDGVNRQITMNDVRRAYYYAEATRDVYIELPKEDPHSARGDMVGKLKFCLYGTREAALNLQETLGRHLIDIGFVRGVGFSSVFVREEKDIWTLVHGDDYCSTGSSTSLSCLDGVLSNRYEIKTQRVGIGEGCTRERQILNRYDRATNEGFEMEADRRHA